MDSVYIYLLGGLEGVWAGVNRFTPIPIHVRIWHFTVSIDLEDRARIGGRRRRCLSVVAPPGQTASDDDAPGSEPNAGSYCGRSSGCARRGFAKDTTYSFSAG